MIVSGQSFDAIKAGGNELKKNKQGKGGGVFTQNGCRFDCTKSNHSAEKKKRKKKKKKKIFHVRKNFSY